MKSYLLYTQCIWCLAQWEVLSESHCRQNSITKVKVLWHVTAYIDSSDLKGGRGWRGSMGNYSNKECFIFRYKKKEKRWVAMEESFFFFKFPCQNVTNQLRIKQIIIIL